MKKSGKDYKELHAKAVDLFGLGVSVESVQSQLQAPKYIVKQWFRGYKKLQEHNLKQRFVQDFETGRFAIDHLARVYGVDRRKLLKWKHEVFGKGSIKRKRMFQMHLAGLPAKAIADYYNVPISQVHLSIKTQKRVWMGHLGLV